MPGEAAKTMAWRSGWGWSLRGEGAGMQTQLGVWLGRHLFLHLLGLPAWDKATRDVAGGSAGACTLASRGSPSPSTW